MITKFDTYIKEASSSRSRRENIEKMKIITKEHLILDELVKELY